MLTVAQVRARAVATPPWVWVAVAALGGVGILVWHQFATTAHPDERWLDPEQPPQMVKPAAETVPLRARCRTYPDSLPDWGESKVGDC